MPIIETLNLTIMTCAEKGEVPAIEKALRDTHDPLSLEAKGPAGQTLLLIASKHNQQALVAYLLAADANVDAQDNDGWTPLHWAAVGKNTNPLIELLLKRGANPHITTPDGLSPLHLAAAHNKDHLVRQLLQAHILVQVVYERMKEIQLFYAS